MAEKTLNIKIALVNKTTEEWESETTVPFKSCPCVEFTEDGKIRLKIGNGVDLFKDLPYISDDVMEALDTKIDETDTLILNCSL